MRVINVINDRIVIFVWTFPLTHTTSTQSQIPLWSDIRDKTYSIHYVQELTNSEIMRCEENFSLI